MKKFLLLFTFFTLATWAQAATLTDPVINLGTITYTSSNPGVRTFTVSATGSPAGNSYALTTSGDGTYGLDHSYTQFNATDLHKYGGHYKWVHIRLTEQNPTPTQDPCGELAITNLQVKTNAAVYSHFAKKSGNPTYIADYPNGIFFPFNATVTPSPDKGRCTITQTYSIFRFAEGDSSEPASSEYTPFNITFSVTIITPSTSFEHDEGAVLNFGTFCRSSQNQTLTVSPTGSVTASSTVCPPSADISADSFTFNSTQASTFSVTVPSSAVDLTNMATGDTVQITNFIPSCSTSCALLNNTATVTVGGTITVPGGSPTGEYTGSYPVSITY